MKELRYILILIIFLIISGTSSFGQSYYITRLHSVSTRTNDEDCPVIINNQIIYVSNRANTSIRKDYDAQKRNYFHLYFSILDTIKKSWSSPKPYSPELKTNLSDGPLAMNRSGNFIAFSSSYYTALAGGIKNNPYVGLFLADKQGDKWGNIKEFNYNSFNAQTTHPTLNQDGNVMYFSSNRAGGFGGYDLYRSRMEKGTWTAPQNLGPIINTPGNEIYPFIHPSGRLYFSSEGHDNNVGGYDIFYSESYNGIWIDPVKLPSPFNSGMKDFSFYVDDKFEKGFFTSNRRGSVDIFTFESSLPTFELSQQQKKDNFCFILFEENTAELDTNLYIYEWDLGDGEKIRNIEAKHCYKRQGKYIVNLNVIDKLTNEVLFNQATYDLNIERIEQAYIICPDTVFINQDIQFNGQQSYFKTMKPGEFYWDFGDGIKGISASARHNYKVPGIYTVKLGVVEDVSNNKNAARKFSSYRTIVVKEK